MKAWMMLRLTIPIDAVVQHDDSLTFLANLRVGIEAESADAVASASRRRRRASGHIGMCGADQALVDAVVPAPVKFIQSCSG